MTRLFISLYPESNEARKNELKTCLLKNIECAAIDEIFILAERAESFDYLPYISDAENKKVYVLPVTVRPTFRTFFNAINHIQQNTGENFGNVTFTNINIIANSDIYFESLPVFPAYNQCFALTRYEIEANGGVRFLNRSDSQDSYIFNGAIKIPEYCHFFIGTPGCDNRICHELKRTGYEVLNPSLTIKTYHLHLGQKSYDNTTERVKTPYLRLNPCELNQQINQ